MSMFPDVAHLADEKISQSFFSMKEEEPCAGNWVEWRVSLQQICRFVHAHKGPTFALHKKSPIFINIRLQETLLSSCFSSFTSRLSQLLANHKLCILNLKALMLPSFLNFMLCQFLQKFIFKVLSRVKIK
jgi:hypothetical protein